MAVHREIGRSVPGLPGDFAAQSSADNKDHKANREWNNLLRLVGAQNALNYTKHGSAMPVLKRIDCQLSSWSEWTASTVPCGVSGTQHSARHRIVTEQCGGTCTSTFQTTRACPDVSCLNGGSLKDGSCFYKEGYSGNFCEKKGKGVYIYLFKHIIKAGGERERLKHSAYIFSRANQDIR